MNIEFKVIKVSRAILDSGLESPFPRPTTVIPPDGRRIIMTQRRVPLDELVGEMVVQAFRKLSQLDAEHRAESKNRLWRIPSGSQRDGNAVIQLTRRGIKRD